MGLSSFIGRQNNHIRLEVNESMSREYPELNETANGLHVTYSIFNSRILLFRHRHVLVVSPISSVKWKTAQLNSIQFNSFIVKLLHHLGMAT
jgi:hypothetical protein